MIQCIIRLPIDKIKNISFTKINITFTQKLVILNIKYFLILFLILNTEFIYANEAKVVHVFVALCDNKNQGIVPVPEKLGNGEDLENNLYWGARYGVKSFYKSEKDWKLIHSSLNINEFILERVVFWNHKKKTYLVADAYKGSKIKKSIENLILSVKQIHIDSVQVYNPFFKKEILLQLAANADLLAFVGHNGLMDFTVDLPFKRVENKKSIPIILLACYSKSYFSNQFKSNEIDPILWTNGLMAPEAYVLNAGLSSWLDNKNFTPFSSKHLFMKDSQSFFALSL
ncbi:MAG TPA: hypothetical protein PLS71_19405 [Leptospiraceae bacterium]|nr:hypothetical protein [Leptospiraceae bacterium]HNC00422.1 hypothetical protein [Leptospiraceae bacterium]HNE11702.1 hypothetical protein [Leptospiraceae bacterium]HNH03015.1 hypothetical protein [Leptospiraceae bacterium]HNI90886.1 hypothetical protein [Leptospiraceae bacterium]